MVPLARVAHSLPGRKRVKIDEKRCDEAYFTALEKGLSGYPGILTVETNPLTGTVLVRHREDDLDFLRYAAEQGLFRLTENELAAHTLPPPSRAAAHQKTAKQKLHAESSNGFNLRPLIFLGLISVGIVQTIEGNIAIPALTAFWYAFNMLPRTNGGNAERLFLEAEPPGES